MRNSILGSGIASAMILLTVGAANGQELGSSLLAPGESQAFALPPISITQSASATIVAGNSISCNAAGWHSDNWYLRRFDLDGDHGIINPFVVSSVDFGVEVAISGNGSTQPVDVNLYTIPVGDPLLFANLNLIGGTSLNLPDQSLSLEHASVVGTVVDPIANDLIVAIFTPNGQIDDHVFFIGSNALGEIAPNYIAAPALGCDVPEPTPLADIGFPNMHTVIIVTGSEEPVPSASASWGTIKAIYR